MGFSWVKIADFLSVSKRTLRNKRAELDITLKYSQITEMQLDAEVQTILTENPNMGEKMFVGTLLSRGIIVQRKMLRKAIERVDPVGKVLRRLRTLRRRAYNVSTPNALWQWLGFTFSAQIFSGLDSWKMFYLQVISLEICAKIKIAVKDLFLPETICVKFY